MGSPNNDHVAAYFNWYRNVTGNKILIENKESTKGTFTTISHLKIAERQRNIKSFQGDVAD
jgi:hypothetical protein